MQIRFIDMSAEGQARTALIKEILPKETLVETFLLPKLAETHPLLTRMLYAELEIYRAYPKKPLDESGKAKVAVKIFDARNHTTCFQGLGFDVKDHTYDDGDLADYRKAVGTFHHGEWGNATLLEIWGADHMKDHGAMVTQAFKYGANLINTRPVLSFHVNPLFKNLHTGKTKLTEDQKIYKYDQDTLLAKAELFGARTPEESRRADAAHRRRNEKAQKKLDDEYLEMRKRHIGI